MTLAICLHFGSIPDHQIHSTDLCCHIGKFEGNALICLDGLAEGGALVGVCLGDLHRVLGEAGSNGADGDTGTVERHHGDFEAQTLSADAVALRNADVVKAQLAGG